MGAEIESTGDLRKLLEFSKGQKVRKLGSVRGRQAKWGMWDGIEQARLLGRSARSAWQTNRK